MSSFSMLNYFFFKELADRLIALCSLLLLSPLLIVVALLVRWNFGSPVIFRQQRPGFRERPFLLLKFRTMTNECDSSGSLLPDSDRLTAFGQWLRSTSIDELPGLINILSGHMSFIGPRPLLMQYLELYSSEQARRHDVKPGFSGWAQVNGRNAISWEDRFRFDIWYVDNRCLILDLKITFITIAKVFFRKGVTSSTGGLMPVFHGDESPSDSQ